MSIAADINPIIAARIQAVKYLEGLDADEVGPLVAVINGLLGAAGGAPLRRSYTAQVTVTARKEWDDYVEIDEDAIRDAVIEAAGNERDDYSGDFDVDSIDTSISVTATVAVEVDLAVEFTDPDGDDLEGAAIDALEGVELGDDWEIDADTASVGEIEVSFS